MNFAYELNASSQLTIITVEWLLSFLNWLKLIINLGLTNNNVCLNWKYYLDLTLHLYETLHLNNFWQQLHILSFILREKDIHFDILVQSLNLMS